MKMTLLSSKGQLTIPKDIQEILGIGHKSKLALYPQRGVLIVKPMTTSIVEQTAGSLAKFISTDKFGKSYTEIMAETKKKAAKSLANE